MVPNAGLMPQGEEPLPPQQQEEVMRRSRFARSTTGKMDAELVRLLVAFTSTARELTKGEVTMWQARVRAALEGGAARLAAVVALSSDERLLLSVEWLALDT